MRAGPITGNYNGFAEAGEQTERRQERLPPNGRICSAANHLCLEIERSHSALSGTPGESALRENCFRIFFI